MSPVRVLPYRTVREDRVVWGPWWRVTDDGVHHPLTERLEAWDYAQSIFLSCDVGVDTAGALEDAGLGSDALLGVAALWDCPSAMERGASDVAVDGGPGEDHWKGKLSLTIPPGAVAHHLIIERQLVLLQPGAPTAGLTAHRRAARLGPSTRDRVVLEGTGGRFPIDPVDFTELGREPAAWALEISYEDPNDAFLGAVRLLVNTQHPAGRALLESTDPQLVSVLRYDLLRKLLVAATDDLDSFRGPAGWDEDSLGGVLADMCSRLLGVDLDTALARMDADPLEFDTTLQARVGFLESVEPTS